MGDETPAPVHADEHVYESLAGAHGGEERWAFGTGFDDPLAGVDAAIPDGVDAAELARTCLVLADDALVLSQRLAGWCSRAPELEDELALANIALDLLGQARLLLARAAQADSSLVPPDAPLHVPGEDALAYFRAPGGFGNVVLAELDDGGDFAVAVVRLLVLVTWRLEVLRIVDSLPVGADSVLRAVAGKAVTELTYHRDYAAGWVVRLGDGTDYSRGRAQAAVDAIWPYLSELAEAAPFARDDVDGVLAQVLAAATLSAPPVPAVPALRGRAGQHTEALTGLLGELQSVARADRDASW